MCFHCNAATQKSLAFSASISLRDCLKLKDEVTKINTKYLVRSTVSKVFQSPPVSALSVNEAFGLLGKANWMLRQFLEMTHLVNWIQDQGSARDYLDLFLEC